MINFPAAPRRFLVLPAGAGLRPRPGAMVYVRRIYVGRRVNARLNARAPNGGFPARSFVEYSISLMLALTVIFC